MFSSVLGYNLLFSAFATKKILLISIGQSSLFKLYYMKLHIQLFGHSDEIKKSSDLSVIWLFTAT